MLQSGPSSLNGGLALHDILQFVKDDNNGISQTEVTYGESTYYKKATEFDLHEIQPVKWQRTVDFNSELKKKNKLNKHAAEKSAKLSDSRTTINAIFTKNTTLDSIKRYRNRHLHSMWLFSRFFFYHQLSKKPSLQV